MKSVKLSRVENGETKTYEYRSLNEACKSFGASSGMNTENATKFLLKQGFTIENIENGKTRKASIIETLIKQVSVIDKSVITKLENELNEIVKTFDPSKSEDALKLVKIRKDLENAKTPKHDLKSILDFVKTAYQEYENENKENA